MVYHVLCLMTQHPRRCTKDSGCSKRLGRRQLLQLLMESRTPKELWYDVKVLCLREGVQTVEEERRRPRFQGFGESCRDKDFAAGMRRIWELGRSSVLRELMEKADLRDNFVQMLMSIKEAEMKVDNSGGDPPEYSPQDVTTTGTFWTER